MTLRIIVTAAILQITLINYLTAQQSDPRWRLNFSAGVMNGDIKNINMEEDEMLAADHKLSISAGIEFSYRIGNGIYLNSGLRYSSYNMDYVSNGIFKGPNTVDGAGCLYRPLYITDYTVKSRINLVSVPVLLQFTTTKKPVHFSFEFGFTNSFSTDDIYDYDGHYEIQGLYYDATYYNVFHLLTGTGPFRVYNPEVELINTKSIILSSFLSAGYVADVTSYVHLSTKFYWERALGDIVVKSDRDKKYESLLYGKKDYKKTKLSGYGMEVGISFDLVKRHK